jgi:hypothetical protein
LGVELDNETIRTIYGIIVIPIRLPERTEWSPDLTFGIGVIIIWQEIRRENSRIMRDELIVCQVVETILHRQIANLGFMRVLDFNQIIANGIVNEAVFR